MPVSHQNGRRGWRWMGITFFYMLSMAYIAALISYHVALALGWG
jgi:ferrous iron transport protein B